MPHRTITIALLSATLVVGGAASPPRATAGEYPVYACEPAFGDVNHSWVPRSNDSRLPAYTACPVASTETRSWNQGLVTRESVTSGPGFETTVPHGAYSQMFFQAPPGAALSRIQYEGTFCAGDSGFTTGLLDSRGYWWRRADRYVDCPSRNDTTVRTHALPNVSAIATETTCLLASACKIDNLLQAFATIRSATVWVTDSTRPTVAITGGSITTPGWHRGTPTVTVAAKDNVGIRRVQVALDGKGAAGINGTCDWTRTVPCSTWPGTLPVETVRVSDGVHAMVAAAQDTAGNWGSASRRVQIDNTAPAGPLDLQVFGSEAWRSVNRFDLQWTNPPQSGLAPIAGVFGAVCPATNPVDDFQGCASGFRSGNGIARLSGLHVPGPGDWTVRLWLVDQAGNADRQTARSIHLRYDGEAPSVALLPRDAADPQRLSVTASDGLSGISSVDVEIRRQGRPEWIALPITREGAVFAARVDDAVLPRGRYDVRARARDAAGNERSTTAAPGGGSAILDLPLRVPTTLRLGGARRSRDRHGRVRTVLKRRPIAEFGERVRMHGRLTTPAGNPLAGADIEVAQQIALPAAPWRRIGLVRTGVDGEFTYRAARGPSRMLRFTYAGTRLVQPRTAYIHLRVRAATSFHVSRRHVVNGDEVVFRGRVLGRTPFGKLVQLQAFSRGGWRTFATTRARDHSHRWRYAYRFSATRGRVRYRFRAVLPVEGGFPYLRGVSRQLGVVVRGL